MIDPLWGLRCCAGAQGQLWVEAAACCALHSARLARAPPVNLSKPARLWYQQEARDPPSPLAALLGGCCCLDIGTEGSWMEPAGVCVTAASCRTGCAVIAVGAVCLLWCVRGGGILAAGNQKNISLGIGLPKKRL